MPADKLICFTVPGVPVPKARPRVTIRGTYTPKSTREFEGRVLYAWMEQSGDSFPPGAPLCVHVWAHFPIPKGGSRARRAALEGAPHTKRGDLDNVVKAVLDALNGAAFPDDAAVCQIFAAKDYRSEPGTAVVITEVQEEIKI